MRKGKNNQTQNHNLSNQRNLLPAHQKGRGSENLPIFTRGSGGDEGENSVHEKSFSSQTDLAVPRKQVRAVRPEEDRTSQGHGFYLEFGRDRQINSKKKSYGTACIKRKRDQRETQFDKGKAKNAKAGGEKYQR